MVYLRLAHAPLRQHVLQLTPVLIFVDFLLLPKSFQVVKSEGILISLLTWFPFQSLGGQRLGQLFLDVLFEHLLLDLLTDVNDVSLLLILLLSLVDWIKGSFLVLPAKRLQLYFVIIQLLSILFNIHCFGRFSDRWLGPCCLHFPFLLGKRSTINLFKLENVDLFPANVRIRFLNGAVLLSRLESIIHGVNDFGLESSFLNELWQSKGFASTLGCTWIIWLL